MSENKINQKEKIITIATGGLCLALAEVLSIIPLYKMPQGGTVTPASMLPLILFALCFGPGWGIAIAFIFSLLQLLDGYLMVPIQVILDYTLAYSVLGLAGFFGPKREDRRGKTNLLDRLAMISLPKMILATVLVIAARLACHVVSGVVFFAEYAPTGQNVWVYSFLYNGSFLGIEAVITVSVLTAIIAATKKSKKMPII